MTEETVFLTPSLIAGQDLATDFVDHFSDVDNAVEIIKARRRVPRLTTSGTVLPGDQTAQVRTIGEAREVLEALGVSEEQIQRNIRFALGV